MLGYFSDGTVVGCPKCDFAKSNVIGMYNQEPIRRWNLKKPDGFTSYKEDKGWVLINYKWKVKVPQD